MFNFAKLPYPCFVYQNHLIFIFDEVIRRTSYKKLHISQLTDEITNWNIINLKYFKTCLLCTILWITIKSLCFITYLFRKNSKFFSTSSNVCSSPLAVLKYALARFERPNLWCNMAKLLKASAWVESDERHKFKHCMAKSISPAA